MCGKCLVRASGALSAPDADESGMITSGWRLACHTVIEGDCHVTLGEERQASIQQEGMLDEISLAPQVASVKVPIQPDTMELRRTDEQRLRDALGMDAARLTSGALRGLPSIAGAGDGYAILRGDEVLAVSADGSMYGVAVDIGTTTVVAILYDLKTGARLGSSGALNAQKPYGDDVISRATYCIENPGGLSELQGVIIGQLNRLIHGLCLEHGVNSDAIYSLVIAGNTVMQHLAAGLHPGTIAAVPFTYVSAFGVHMTARELGLSVCPDALIYWPACASGYVGGDITAGVIAAGLHKSEKTCLYIDIGTNGEIAFGDSSGIQCCATAAGPAFEGAEIKYGMGGLTGAIDKVTYENGSLRCETIGGAPAVGICGSGLLDAVAVMLACGVLDETGLLLDPEDVEGEGSGFIVECDGEKQFVLSGHVAVTAGDVRKLQLAKAAIAAGVQTMLAETGKSVDDVEKLYIAGGFGSHIDKNSAAAIGLIPKELLDKTVTIGNAAGAGASLALLNEDAKAEMAAVATKMKYSELSGNPVFMDYYVECMMFE